MKLTARGFAAVAAAVGAVLLWAAGCAGPRTPRAVEDAQALERGGEHDAEALAAWSRIADTLCAKAQMKGDPKDDCGLSLIHQAQLLENLGRTAEAAVLWETAADRAGHPVNAARALARASELYAGPLGDPDHAARDAWKCIDHWPGEMPTDVALSVAVRLDRARDPRALLAKLDALAPRIARDDLVDNVRFAAAEIAEHELADPKDAVRRYDALAADYRRSSLRDDALWRAAHLLRDAGDPEGALKRLQLLLATRRRALITGSYNSEWLDDAQLLAGRIYLDDLHDPARAATAFLFLADDFKDSILRDDALLELARARLAAGDHDGACAALDRLITQFPDGNQLRATGEKRAALACPPAKPSAPR